MPLHDQYYESKEFKETLRKYEEAKKNGESIYLDPDELTDIAEYYHILGNVNHAIDVINEAIYMFPGAVSPLSFRARVALLKEDNPQKANEYAEQIEDKSDLEYFYIKAEIMIVENKIEEADEYLEAQYEDMNDEDRADFVIDVATLFADYDALEKAQKWLMRSEETDDPDYQEMKGRIALAKGNYEESERIFNTLIDQDPYSSPYWNHLASTQLMRNNIRDAIQSSEFSIAINPNDEEAILNKANGLLSLGNYEEAYKYFKRYSELCPNEESGQLFQGIAMLNLGNIEKGIEHLKNAEKLMKPDSPSQYEIYQELAFALSRKGELQEALDYAAKLYHVEGPYDKNEALVLRGHLFMENGQMEEAQKCFSKAINDSNGSPKVFLRIAISTYDNGYYKSAYRMLNTLRRVTDADYNEGYSYMALCCQALGLTDEFLENVKTACEVNPQEARIVLGELFPTELEPQDYYHYLLSNNPPTL